MNKTDPKNSRNASGLLAGIFKNAREEGPCTSIFEMSQVCILEDEEDGTRKWLMKTYTFMTSQKPETGTCCLIRCLMKRKYRLSI